MRTPIENTATVTFWISPSKIISLLSVTELEMIFFFKMEGSGCRDSCFPLLKFIVRCFSGFSPRIT